MVLIILATIGLTFFRLRKLINLLTIIASGLYILAAMCFQLGIAKEQIEKDVFLRNCSEVKKNIEKSIFFNEIFFRIRVLYHVIQQNGLVLN